MGLYGFGVGFFEWAMARYRDQPCRWSLRKRTQRASTPSLSHVKKRNSKLQHFRNLPILAQLQSYFLLSKVAKKA